MLYVDANVFLNAALYDDEEAHLAKKFLLETAKGRHAACTSILTWDEVVWVIRKTIGHDKAVEEGERFLQLPNVKLLPVEQMTISSAQNLIGQYGLKPRDAIHAATALMNGVSEIISDDPDFDVLKGMKRVPIGLFSRQ